MTKGLSHQGEHENLKVVKMYVHPLDMVFQDFFLRGIFNKLIRHID